MHYARFSARGDSLHWTGQVWVLVSVRALPPHDTAGSHMHPEGVAVLLTLQRCPPPQLHLAVLTSSVHPCVGCAADMARCASVGQAGGGVEQVGPAVPDHQLEEGSNRRLS